eukprot:Em0017g467a
MPRLMPVGASYYLELDPMLLRHMKGESCPAVSSSCHTCGLEGHFARVCIKSGKAIVKKGKGKQVNSVETETREGTPSSGEEESRVLNTIRAIKSVSAKVEVQLNGRPITMLYDPGASRSIISKRMWIKIGSPPLKPTSSLVAYTNVTVDTCGEAVVAVKLKEKVQHLAVVVVRKHDFPLFGLDWCLSFGLELPSLVRLDSVNQLGEPQKQSEIELEALISEYQELFGDDLGVIKGHKAVVHLKSNITPKVYSARPLPFAMKESVEIELRRLVDKSIIEPVDTQSHPVEWASPIVCVRKASGAIRICGDQGYTKYVDPHPLPRFEDLMSKITEKPVAYASRRLSKREQQYAAIDKEALAIVFGIIKFHQYVYGRHFTLQTDHKPLERNLGAHREIPRMVANRLQRWALTLSAYDYELKVVQGKENVVADFLSRLPLSSTNASAAERVGESDVLLNVRLGDLSLTRRDLQRESQRDEVLKRVIAYVDWGWPVDRSKVSPEFTTFWEKRESLSFENGILLWSGRIVVPYSLRKQVLTLLHEGHPGIWAMRALARFYVWWPRIDSEIEVFLKGCYSCQENRPRAPETLLYSWNSPSEPWARIHIDYAGPFEGMYWLCVVDSYSKWVEIKCSTSMTAVTTIKLLREIFCQLGILKVIVPDNGPQFVSQEFQEFCNQNYITHIKSTPYHPKTNDLAERMVRTFKERLRAGKNSSADLDLRLQRFLLSYSNTPHKSTGRSPAELLMGYRLRSKLDLLKPDANSSSDKSSVMQKLYHDNEAQPRWFFQDEAVWVQKPSQQGYVAGIIKKRYSDYSYLVDINRVVRRKHADQLRVRHKEQSDEPADEPVIEERDTFMHYTHFNHSDCSDTHPQRDMVNNPDPPSPVMVPSEENEPELQPVVSLPQQGTVGQEEKSDETVGGSETNVAQDKTGNGDTSVGGLVSPRPRRNRRPPARPYDKYLQDPRAK